MTQDEHKILTTINTMTKSFQNNDIEAVMASYEAQATIAFEPGVPVSDASKLRQMFSAMAMASLVFDYYAGHDVFVNGDVAMHIAP